MAEEKRLSQSILPMRQLEWELLPSGVALITIDVAGSKVNVLSTNLLADLDSALDALEKLPELKGIVVASGKSAGFGAGADIALIARMQKTGSREDVLDFLAEGKRVFNRLAQSMVPTVAVIGPGDCLGGMAEVALACQYRIAAQARKQRSVCARIGFPEVSLGLLPGLGGTVRVYELAGLEPALEILASGKTLDATSALAKGLVDEICDEEAFSDRAEAMALEPPRVKRGEKSEGIVSWLKKWLKENTAAGIRKFGEEAKKHLERKTHGAYPAPLKILDLLLAIHQGGPERAYEIESEAFADLALTGESRNLVWAFAQKQARQRMRADVPAKGGVKRLGVIGAGVMGTGIACQAAVTGTEVILFDTSSRGLVASMLRVWMMFQGQVERGNLEPLDARALFRKIRFTLSLAEGQTLSHASTELVKELDAAASKLGIGFKEARLILIASRQEMVPNFSTLVECDLIVEAVFEDIKVKQDLVAKVEEVMGDRPFFFASSTITLKLAKVFEASRRPERTLGLRFFNPVERVPACEVVRWASTADETMIMGGAFVAGLKQVPIASMDSNGFIVNRILGPYFAEATRLVWSGVSVAAIDRAAERFGMFMGPLELLDKVGHNIACSVSQNLSSAFGQRLAQSPLFDALAPLNLTGAKGGKGFYLYDESGTRQFDKTKKSYVLNSDVAKCIPSVPREMEEAVIQERLFLAMVNEAARILEEGVAASAADVDMALILVIGWAPGRGGPLHYADEFGIERLVGRLSTLSVEVGENFKPCNLLIDMAARKRRFYS